MTKNNKMKKMFLETKRKVLEEYNSLLNVLSILKYSTLILKLQRT